jgi:pyruvate/2-oxoglutarate/acetoin dehydrogenase E1 component
MPEMTTGQAIKEALSLCLDANNTTFIAGEDIGVYGGAFGVTDGLLAKYGEDRIKDTRFLYYMKYLGFGPTSYEPLVHRNFKYWKR